MILVAISPLGNLRRSEKFTRGDCGKISTARGSRQVVRRQPSKLIFVGSNPISRSDVRCFSVKWSGVT